MGSQRVRHHLATEQQQLRYTGELTEKSERCLKCVALVTGRWWYHLLRWGQNESKGQTAWGAEIQRGLVSTPKPPNPLPFVYFFILQPCGHTPTGAREFKESPEKSLFILFLGFSRQEYWSGLPFPSPGAHILSDLSTMTWPSWVAPHGMA